jgi:hypothetical protein
MSQEQKDPATAATATDGLSTPIKVRELEQAAEKGLQVDLVAGSHDDSPISLMSASPQRDLFNMDIGNDSDNDDLL